MNYSAYLKTMLRDAYVKPVFETLEDCFQQGQAASDQCYRRNENPYQKGEAKHEWWDAGWSGSLEELTGENQ